ncbi:MAG: RHS repeat-associated core domain-containing protein [Verrucomicrobiota bacterium]|nr:RHS repeat-associated core domain-containing protein [Verrucomicrobiota bacterium]
MRFYFILLLLLIAKTGYSQATAVTYDKKVVIPYSDNCPCTANCLEPREYEIHIRLSKQCSDVNTEGGIKKYRFTGNITLTRKGPIINNTNNLADTGSIELYLDCPSTEIIGEIGGSSDTRCSRDLLGVGAGNPYDGTFYAYVAVGDHSFRYECLIPVGGDCTNPSVLSYKGEFPVFHVIDDDDNTNDNNTTLSKYEDSLTVNNSSSCYKESRFTITNRDCYTQNVAFLVNGDSDHIIDGVRYDGLSPNLNSIDLAPGEERDVVVKVKSTIIDLAGNQYSKLSNANIRIDSSRVIYVNDVRQVTNRTNYRTFKLNLTSTRPDKYLTTEDINISICKGEEAENDSMQLRKIGCVTDLVQFDDIHAETIYADGNTENWLNITMTNGTVKYSFINEENMEPGVYLATCNLYYDNNTLMGSIIIKLEIKDPDLVEDCVKCKNCSTGDCDSTFRSDATLDSLNYSIPIHYDDYGQTVDTLNIKNSDINLLWNKYDIDVHTKTDNAQILYGSTINDENQGIKQIITDDNFIDISYFYVNRNNDPLLIDICINVYSMSSIGPINDSGLYSVVNGSNPIITVQLEDWRTADAEIDKTRPSWSWYWATDTRIKESIYNNDQVYKSKMYQFKSHFGYRNYLYGEYGYYSYTWELLEYNSFNIGDFVKHDLLAYYIPSDTVWGHGSLWNDDQDGAVILRERYNLDGSISFSEAKYIPLDDTTRQSIFRYIPKYLENTAATIVYGTDYVLNQLTATRTGFGTNKKANYEYQTLNQYGTPDLRPSSVIYSDLSWHESSYNYDPSTGVLMPSKYISPFANTPHGHSELECNVTNYSYNTAVTNIETINEIEHKYISSTKEYKSLGNITKVETKTIYTPLSTTEYDKYIINSTAYTGIGNRISEEKWKNIPVIGNKIIYKKDSDGIITKYTYTLLSDNTQEIKTKTGLWDGDTFLKGTEVLETINSTGQRISYTKYDKPSNYIVEDIYYTDYDIFSRPQTITYNMGTGDEYSEYITYNCCDKESINSQNNTINYGKGTEFRYGILTNYKTETRMFDDGSGNIQEITTKSYYNAQNNIIEQIIVDSAGNELPVGKWLYNSAGLLQSEINANNNSTNYNEYESDFWVKQTTYPDNSASQIMYNRDGSIAQVGGTASLGKKYNYSVVTVSGIPYTVTKESWLNTDQTEETQEWVETWMDPIGRIYKKIHSNEESDAVILYEYYGTSSKVSKISDPLGQVTLYFYNDVNELEETRICYNNTDMIDSLKKDRKVTYAKAYTSVTAALPDAIGNKTYTVLRSTIRNYLVDGSDTYTESVSENSIGNHYARTASNGLTQDIFNVTDSESKTHTQYIVGSDKSLTKYIFHYDNIIQEEIKSQAGDIISKQEYSYDNYGRLASVTDGRNNIITYDYYPDTSIKSLTYSESSSGSADERQTYYEYSARGWKTREEIRDVNSTSTLGWTAYDYYSTGLLKKTVSTQAGYPSAYTYDYAGRVKTLTTWKGYNFDSPEISTGASETVWNYYTKSGLLQNKTYETVSGQPASPIEYTWRKDSRLKTKTNGRGQIIRYAYTVLGDLDTVDMLDDTVIEIDYNYLRDGRIDTITDASGTRQHSYANGFPSIESYTSGALSGWGLTRTWDDGRLASLTLQKTGSAALPTVAYSYLKPGTALDAGRLTSVTQGSLEFVQSYETQSMISAGVNAKRSGSSVLNTTQSHDKWGRLSTYVSGNHSYTYRTNQLDRREIVLRENGEYWHYQYDNLGQVASAKRYKKLGTTPDPITDTPVLRSAFDYAFDTIGNRTQTTALEHIANWSSNALNEITERDIPGFATVLGVAGAAAAVSVNDVETTRLNERFYGELSVDNSAAAQYPTLEVKATQTGIGGTTTTETESGHQFIAKTPEVFSYDADGNLTQDGRWDYTWNALNHLTQMETRTTAAAAGAPQQRLDFTYDSQGRRISKTVSLWNTTTSNYQPTTTTYFLYDGWNLIQELKTEHGTPNTSSAKRFVWGLDISRSLQGAGGVQGLLAIADDTTGKSYLPTYDGHGNIVHLVDATTGTTTADFEYAPFGEMIRATGPALGVCPFGFSTKYLDAETGLYYYGYRYYSAVLGRWVNRDPIGEKGGVNEYCLTFNAPIHQYDYLGESVRKISDTSAIGKDFIKSGYSQYESQTGQIITEIASCNVVVFYGHGIATYDSEGEKVDFSKLTIKQKDETSDVPVTVINQPCSSSEIFGCNSGRFVTVQHEIPGAINPKSERQGNMTADLENLWSRALKEANRLCVAEKNCCKEITVRFICKMPWYQQTDYCGKVEKITCSKFKK